MQRPMPAAIATVRDMLRRLDAELEAVGAEAPVPLTSIMLTIPDIPAGVPGAPADRFVWRCPAEGVVFVGGGTARDYVPDVAAPLAAIRRTAAAWRREWRYRDPDGTALLPVALFGFDFYDHASTAAGRRLPPARLWVPQVLLARRAGQTCAVFSASAADMANPARLREIWRGVLEQLLAPPKDMAARDAVVLETSVPPGERPAWERRVEDALAAIRASSMEKVVVTRQARVTADRPIAVEAVAERLTETYPDCTTVVVSTPKGALVAATPEKLVSLRGRTASCDALAGTAHADATHLGKTAKDQEEHRHVVTAIRQALSPVAAAIDHPPTPLVRRLSGLLHLHTPIQAQLAAACDILTLAQRLHPTPAVGGTPRDQAMAWLAAHGEPRAAWYTGAVGWMDAAGDGDAVVVLRCGWLAGREALLSAGAGIVAGSSPAAEWDETELKLSALRTALAYG